jgi:ferredoxin-NADP reductase
MSILRYLTDRSWRGRIHLVYAARTERDIVFRDELAHLVRRFPNLRAIVTLTRVESDAWTGTRGRISRETLAPLEPDLARSLVYVCGPDDMMRATTSLLAELGVPGSRIRTEAFVSPADGTPASPTTFAAGEDVDGTFKVRFEVSAKDGEAGSERTILEASEEAGIPIAFECRSGICGQCKVRLVDGDVRMEVDAALSKEDRAKRLVLACQARPLRDVVIDA